VGNLGGDVVALSAATGAESWSTSLGGPVVGSPAVVGGVVFLEVSSATAPAITALDAGTGTILWSTGAIADPTLAVAGGLVYYSSPLGGSVYALDSATGKYAWSFGVGGEIEEVGSPAVADGSVFVQLGGSVYALDARTGAQEWSRANDGVGQSAPAISGGAVFVGSAEDLTAVDEAAGIELWQRRLPARDSSPALANGVVYIGARGRLRAFDARTGISLWLSRPSAAEFDASPAVSNGVVYIGADDGTIRAYALP
jgi:outer membrane protein assembly factor BamB